MSQNINDSNEKMKRIDIERIVINIGVGKSGDPFERAKMALTDLTGQKPSPRGAKKYFFAPLGLGFCPVKSVKAIFALSKGSPDFPTPIFITIFSISILFIFSFESLIFCDIIHSFTHFYLWIIISRITNNHNHINWNFQQPRIYSHNYPFRKGKCPFFYFLDFSYAPSIITSCQYSKTI